MEAHVSWFLFLGFLLLFAALSRSFIKRFPLSTGILYFLIGVSAGPYGFHLLKIDIIEHAKWLEVITEIAVVVSLFTAGLKLHVNSMGDRWRNPVRLATLGMLLSVFGVALALNQFWGYAWGAAILFGAIIAPTDPVLASDVQVEEVHDRDRLRFSLTGEGCLNDGSAFPFVMLGLGLLGLHELGDGAWRWIAVDVLWASAGGLAIGFGLGHLVGRLAQALRDWQGEKIEADEFLALGLIALSYGLALLAQTYGFLAVFAAGFALRNFRAKAERTANSSADAERETEEVPDAVLGFNEGLERILEIAVVVIFGALFHLRYFSQSSIVVALVLLFVIRPLSAAISLYGAHDLNRIQKNYIFWFGVRGVGSLYYYFYALNHGLDPQLARSLLALTYVSILLSLLVHGISVTPLMNFYSGKIWRKS